jgi:predicted O-linked N-acetylglucosamine transferase (SPINDLY family)
MIALWSRLLRELPQARLVLKAYGLAAESARRALSGEFTRCGIAPERVALLPPDDSLTAHLARYHEIDVALDVHPYNGTTTTCEALWMGVPVVTLAGRSHVSRVGASLLARAGLADLVAASEDEYLAKARSLARDLDRRRELRASLRRRLSVSPLLDAAGFTRALESAYMDMWKAYANGGDED